MIKQFFLLFLLNCLALFILIGFYPNLFLVSGTGSMYPLLRGGDVIRVEENFDEIELGDIIVFYHTHHNKNFVHRVVEIRYDGKLITQGDNNNAPDSIMITEENYKGTVAKNYGTNIYILYATFSLFVAVVLRNPK